MQKKIWMDLLRTVLKTGKISFLLISKFEISARDIVLANPMYPDQSDSKSRPLLIISNSIFHQNSGFFVCTGITTAKKSDPYLLPLPRKQVENGILDFES